MTTESKLAEIRTRTEKQQSRYGFRWNQLLRDRRDLLAEVDRRQGVINEAYAALVADEDEKAYDALRPLASKEFAKRANDTLSVTERVSHE